MQPVVDWLNKLGMSEYEQRFADNGINAAALPYLTDQDLKDIGVLLGHRRIMLAAIAALNAASTPAAAEPIAPEPADAVPMPASSTLQVAAGERRYLTVMFCDLVGSTAISARLDAEEWRDLVRAYVDAASAAVTEMGGYVAKKLGDGLFVLFGYPVAHENDSERAARAALSIQRALADLNRKHADAGKPELMARIGLDTGLAVVDAAGEIYGDVPNIAARVQTLAEPGTVIVTAQVQRQVAGLFVAEERGSHQLKGVPEPVALYRLVRASGGGRRLGQRHLTPLAGRAEEISMLMRRWEQARQGGGQLALILGEPGVGKSRLIEEFHARLRDSPHTWAEWSCSQLLENTPLHPIAEWGRVRFGGADTPTEQRLADLESSLVQVNLDPAENLPLLAPLLDIPLPPERVPALPPDELRRRQMAALIAWPIAGAQVQPVVLAIEDVHWADPTTLDLLRGIAERGAMAPLFVVITARTEFRPQWGTRSHHSTIALSPLDRQQVREMVGELAVRHALEQEVIDSVTERTGGVPLFVEEVTRLLLERGEPGVMQVIPPTLQQSLLARLDRLGPAREVAQIGAVIGRDFSYSLLHAVAAIENAPLRAALERLADADIVLVQGLPPQAEYRFKHALIRDAAYENMLKSTRRVFHRRLAETLRDQAVAGAAAEPELLAHHFTQAGRTEEAAEWWGNAGQRSLERSALVEAATQFTRALDLIAALPGTPSLRRQQIKLQVGFAFALYYIKGFSADETKAAFDQARALMDRAEALGEPAEDPLLLYSILYGLFIAKFIAFDGEAARALATQFLALAEQQKATAPIMIGHRLLANTLLALGEPADALEQLDRAFVLYDPAAHRSLATRFGHDIGAATLSFRSLTLWLLGFPDAALAEVDRALKAARDTAHAPTLAFALSSTALTQSCCRNHAAASAQLEECLALTGEKGGTLFRIMVETQLGCLTARSGNASEAVKVISGGVGGLRSIGATVWVTSMLPDLALAYAELGQFDSAWRSIGEIMTAIGTTTERWYEPEVNRTAGEIALKSPQPDAAKAQTYFNGALAVSREQQAKSWELRAAMSLARLLRDQDRRDEARDLLAPVYGWFTEGFDTPDLKDAKALLAELAFAGL
jgi:class 3 adenylate cyclase/predicted ATPase